jgi:antitoxin MazE
MKISITKIGNSKGIIIPAAILKRLTFGNSVVLEEQDDGLVIKKARSPREGWEDQIRKEIEKNGSIKEEIPYVSTKFDQEEWEW